MLLSTLLVADPVDDIARLVADQCDRLANQVIVCRTADDLLTSAAAHHPEMAVVSLEMAGRETGALIKKLRTQNPQLFIVASYRELGVPAMEKLARKGVEDFVAHPIDATELYRAASRRFRRPFRRHTRHSVTLDVFRADGVLIGRTRDISEGGLGMDAIHPIPEDGSMLLELRLPNDDVPLRVRSEVLRVEGTPPAPVMAAIRFENLRGRDQQRLAGYLKSLGGSESTG